MEKDVSGSGQLYCIEAKQKSGSPRIQLLALVVDESLCGGLSQTVPVMNTDMRPLWPRSMEYRPPLCPLIVPIMCIGASLGDSPVFAFFSLALQFSISFLLPFIYLSALCNLYISV